MLRNLIRSLGATGWFAIAAIVWLVVLGIRPHDSAADGAYELASSVPDWLPITSLAAATAGALLFHLLRTAIVLACASTLLALWLHAVVVGPEHAASIGLPVLATIALARLLPMRSPTLSVGSLLIAGLATASLLVYFDVWPPRAALRFLEHQLIAAGDRAMTVAAACIHLLVLLAWFSAWRQHSQRPVLWFVSLLVVASSVPLWTAEIALIDTARAIAVAAVGFVALLDSIRRLAFDDELTGVGSRRAFDDAYRSLRGRYSIALVDIDHFKKINDRYGHDAGDQVLRSVAAKLRETRGAEVFRYGGEEFALLFRRREATQAEQAADEARRRIAGKSFQVRKAARAGSAGRMNRGRAKAPSRGIRVRISAGIADDSTGSVPLVLEAADKALYRAKRAGRNRVVVARVKKSKGAKPRGG